MPVTVVIGLQWGDEGKGRIVDRLAQSSDVVARFNAGANAGHTVIHDGRKIILHLVPAGILQPSTTCLIANGVIVEPFSLAEEITTLAGLGIHTEGRLWASPRCHLVLPYHRTIDRLHEEAKGGRRTGTTGRGIGPTYADKVSYLGLRLGDLYRPDLLRERLGVTLEIKNRLLVASGEEPLVLDALVQSLHGVAARLAPYVRETYSIIQQAIAAGQYVLMAGANGVLLDNDFGSYPFCTGSTVLASGVGHGAGVAPRQVDHVLGVLKAYTTRVGGGPFPTELADETGEEIRRVGAEFGATTGRPRRCGWFDGPLARFATQLNGCDGLALTKLDVLDGLPQLRLATGYRLDGAAVNDMPVDAADMERLTVEYEDMPGWQQSTSAVRRYQDLPVAARRYIERIEALAGAPVKLITVGPGRESVIPRET